MKDLTKQLEEMAFVYANKFVAKPRAELEGFQVELAEHFKAGAKALLELLSEGVELDEDKVLSEAVKHCESIDDDSIRGQCEQDYYYGASHTFEKCKAQIGLKDKLLDAASYAVSESTSKIQSLEKELAEANKKLHAMDHCPVFGRIKLQDDINKLSAGLGHKTDELAKIKNVMADQAAVIIVTQHDLLQCKNDLKEANDRAFYLEKKHNAMVAEKDKEISRLREAFSTLQRRFCLTGAECFGDNHSYTCTDASEALAQEGGA